MTPPTKAERRDGESRRSQKASGTPATTDQPTEWSGADESPFDVGGLPEIVERAVARNRSVIPQLNSEDGRKGYIKWKPYQEQRPTLDEVVTWHLRFPRAMWAIVTGQVSDLVVFDFDPDKGGDETMRRLGVQPSILTPSGGAHVYCKWPGWEVKTLAAASPLLPGLDLKGEGGLATIHGTRNGGTYRLAEKPFLYKPDTLPPELLDLLAEQKRNPPSRFVTPPNFSDFVGVDELLAEALAMVAQGQPRNQAGFHLCCQLRDEGKDEDEALPVLERYVEAVNRDARHAYTEQEAYESLRSAYKWPPRAPRRLRCDRPTIDTSGKELHELAEAAAAALVQMNGDPPAVYVRGDVLARVVDGDDGVYLDPYTRHTFNERLSRVAHWTRTKPATQRSPQTTSLVRPDGDVIGFLLDKKEYDGLPPVDRVVTAPVLGPDGSVVTQPGYHAATRTLYRPGPELEGLELPASVTPKDLTRALRWLDELIGNDEWRGFPFAGKSDRAHAVALFLLPFLREMIDGPTPLHLVDAPTAGTGKGLLGQAVTYPGVGKVGLVPEPGTHTEEWRKTLTSLLSRAPALIFFDNISGVLGGSALEAVLTAPIWEDRILGVSRMMKAKVRNIWVATSNNAKLTSDMPRRCLLIRLDAEMERPAERAPQEFRHGDLLPWVYQHRRELVQAALTICLAWVQEGMPKSRHAFGSYEAWASVMGGVLEVAGIPGFLDNRDELFVSANSEEGEMAEFLAAWAKEFPEPLKARELADRLSYSAAVWDVVPAALSPYRYDDNLTKQVSYLLRRHRDRVFGGLRLEGIPAGGGLLRWHVRAVESE